MKFFPRKYRIAIHMRSGKTFFAHGTDYKIEYNPETQKVTYFHSNNCHDYPFHLLVLEVEAITVSRVINWTFWR